MGANTVNASSSPSVTQAAAAATTGFILIKSASSNQNFDVAIETCDEEFNSLSGASLLIDSANNQQQQQQLDNIIVEQTSKLGIILQTKVLEEKMHSFITLMDEQQLNPSEQRQVYDNIKVDYENLLKNYQQAKLKDKSDLMPRELDMDV